MSASKLSRNAFRLIDAARSMCEHVERTYRLDPGTMSARPLTSRLEEINVYDGWANEGPDSVVITGNWNAPDYYDRYTQARVKYPGGEIIERLGQALERLGCEVEWSDQHAMCDGCYRCLRIDADSMSWRPEYHLGDGYITCVSCLMDGVRVDDVAEGFARIAWCDVYANVVEEAGEATDVALSGRDITDVAPETPQEAKDYAGRCIDEILGANKRRAGGLGYTTPDLAHWLRAAVRADILANKLGDLDGYATRFGECLYYQYVGHGVSWSEDHAEIPSFETPRGESCHDLEPLAAEELGIKYLQCETADGEPEKWAWVREDYDAE